MNGSKPNIKILEVIKYSYLYLFVQTRKINLFCTLQNILKYYSDFLPSKEFLGTANINGHPPTCTL